MTEPRITNTTKFQRVLHAPAETK